MRVWYVSVLEALLQKSVKYTVIVALQSPTVLTCGVSMPGQLSVAELLASAAASADAWSG